MLKNPPTISIVTPSFNQGRFLDDCMNSVINQSYPALEYVLMDGGSSDDSPEIIRRYADQLTHYEIAPDKGHADAINRGFEHTSGEIMAWLNSDDMYLPWTLRAVAEIFSQHPEVEWISGLNGTWSEHGLLTEAFKSRKNRYDFLLGDYAWIQQESVFWRRSLWDKAGGSLSPKLSYMIDGELWGRFFQHAELFHVSCLLGGFRKYGSNRSLAHAEECHQEMHEVVANLRTRVSPEAIEDLRNFQRVRRCLGAPIPGRWSLLYPFMKKRYSSSFQRAAYRELRYVDGSWKPFEVPFDVEPKQALSHALPPEL